MVQFCRPASRFDLYSVSSYVALVKLQFTSQNYVEKFIHRFKELRFCSLAKFRTYLASFCGLVLGVYVRSANYCLDFFLTDQFRSCSLFRHHYRFISKNYYYHRDRFPSEIKQEMVSTDHFFQFEPFMRREYGGQL